MLRLYRAPFSTNVERVALALAHKGLEVESMFISYEDRSLVEEVSGQGLVPVIERPHGTKALDRIERNGERGSVEAVAGGQVFQRLRPAQIVDH